MVFLFIDRRSSSPSSPRSSWSAWSARAGPPSCLWPRGPRRPG